MMRRWDIVLAADCVFWLGLFSPLLDTLGALAGSPASAGAPPRFFLTVTERLGRAEVFRAKAAAAGWELLEVRSGGVSFPYTNLYEARRASGVDVRVS